jgi:hypothetical protein
LTDWAKDADQIASTDGGRALIVSANRTRMNLSEGYALSKAFTSQLDDEGQNAD